MAKRVFNELMNELNRADGRAGAGRARSGDVVYMRQNAPRTAPRERSASYGFVDENDADYLFKVCFNEEVGAFMASTHADDWDDRERCAADNRRRMERLHDAAFDEARAADVAGMTSDDDDDDDSDDDDEDPALPAGEGDAAGRAAVAGGVVPRRSWEAFWGDVNKDASGTARFGRLTGHGQLAGGRDDGLSGARARERSAGQFRPGLTLKLVDDEDDEL